MKAGDKEFTELMERYKKMTPKEFMQDYIGDIPIKARCKIDADFKNIPISQVRIIENLRRRMAKKMLYMKY